MTGQMHIGLAALLQRHKISQKQLATAANMRPATVNAIYNARIERVEISTLVDLVSGLRRLGIQADVGDILQVVPSGHVSFMWSYPNLIPLSASVVKRMARILEPFAFDAVYGAFSGRGQIDTNGKQVVADSVARFVARISEP